jgi:hypothetical protein
LIEVSKLVSVIFLLKALKKSHRSPYISKMAATHAKCNAPQGLKLKNMEEKSMHNLFLKNMSGLIEESRNPSVGENP